MGFLKALFRKGAASEPVTPSPTSAGRDAIDVALHGLYRHQEAKRFGGVATQDGQPPSLAEIVVHAVAGPDPHWHYVTYGLSEVFGKQSANPDLSGWGFELTFRLARKAGEGEPAPWPLAMLIAVADYVFSSSTPVAPFHVMRLTAAVDLRSLGTELETALFIEDPQLPEVRSVNGRLRFLEVALITRDEEDLVARWDAVRFAEELRAVSPLFVTDLTRRSLLSSDRAGVLLATAAREGSSRELEYLQSLDLQYEPGMNKKVILRLSEFEADLIARLLETRVALRRRARIAVQALTLSFLSTDAGFEPWTAGTETDVSIALPPERVAEVVASLRQRRSFKESWFAELEIHHRGAATTI